MDETLGDIQTTVDKEQPVPTIFMTNTRDVYAKVKIAQPHSKNPAMKRLPRSCAEGPHVNPSIINKTQTKNRVRF
jgi:hypothetical protein